VLIKDFENFITDTFTKEKLEIVKGKNEYGFTNIGNKDIFKLGYCTNLTIESAQEAASNNVNLLITHHDAWEWMRENCCSCVQEKHMTIGVFVKKMVVIGRDCLIV
jgi:putative NIF3 family GTP cyclohydrolase 1 type 2